VGTTPAAVIELLILVPVGELGDLVTMYIYVHGSGINQIPLLVFSNL